MPIALAVHGGAWNIPDAEVEAHRRGITRALDEGWRALRHGVNALDAVELCVRILEDDPTFNAGRGSHLNSAGRLELDASIMDGRDLRAGAVAAVEGLRHPVSAARLVMERSPHVMLVGRGARDFAKAHAAETCPTTALLVGRELEKWRRVRRGERALVDDEFHGPPHGTVGATACDRRGHVAAATSTGGTQDKAPGRVGDTPIIGAGTFADDRRGAASSTGWGEAILRAVLAKTAVDALARRHAPQVACREAIAALRRVGGHGGIIVVDRWGRGGAGFNTPRMARGIQTLDDGPMVAIGRSERAR